jgi:hypothetical protein
MASTAYKCSFCEEETSFGCFACSRRFCSKHGRSDISQCQECYVLRPIGDAYRFKLPGGRIVEDISDVDDHDLRQMLAMYTNKVKELETLIIGAKHQQTALQHRLKLIPPKEVGGLGTVRVQSYKTDVPRKRRKPATAADLNALVDLLAKNPELAKGLLERKK